MAKSKNATNREQYYHQQMAALGLANLEGQVSAPKLENRGQGRILINFFEREYLASHSGIEALGKAPVTMDHKSVMANYLIIQGQGELSNEFVPIGRLTGMLETKSSPSDHLIAPLTEKFGDKYSRFAEAAQKIGGQPQGQSPSGGESWLFWPLPKLPVQIIFFEADDEFPADVKVLFDSSARDFVTYECLELLEIVLVLELLLAANLLGCGNHNHHTDGDCGGGCGNQDGEDCQCH